MRRERVGHRGAIKPDDREMEVRQDRGERIHSIQHERASAWRGDECHEKV